MQCSLQYCTYITYESLLTISYTNTFISYAFAADDNSKIDM